MGLSLGKKIFLTFTLLLTLALSLSIVITRGARDLIIAAERTEKVKDFQLRRARVEELAHTIAHSTGRAEAVDFEAEIGAFLELGEVIESFDLPYPGRIRSDIANLDTMGANYRRAYDELFRRYQEDRAFLAAAGEAHRRLAELAGRLSPGIRATYFERLNHYAFRQDEIYHSRDGSFIAGLKEIAVSIKALNPPEDVLAILDHLTLSVEKNYLNSLAMSDRERFLESTGNAFTTMSENVLHYISVDSLDRQRRSARLAWILIALFSAFTLAALVFFTRYVRLVTDSLANAISAIRDERYDYEIDYAPRDEFGNLMRFMKEMAGNLGQSIAAVREGEAFLQEIIDGIAEPIMLIDLDYRIRLMNRKAREAVPRQAAENGNRFCYEVSHNTTEPCRGSDHACPLEDVIRSGGMVKVEHTHKDGAGQCRVVEIVASPLLDGEGNIKGIIEAGRDITDRKKIEEELLQAHRELEKRYRQLKVVDEMKSSLIQDVSHELKTPVAKHSMQLEILRPLLAKHSLTGEEAKAFAVMEESIRRQEDVIRNLLDLSRLESGRQRYSIAPLRLDELLARVRSDYLYAIEQCGGSVDCSVSAVVIESDKDMLWHLFSNLLNNAIKFRKKDQPVRIGITAEVDAGTVKVRITDDGLGLSEEEKKKVFDRFYQSTASSEGSGVGLTICRMIAEDLGGKVDLLSEGRERGSTALVTLPLSKGPPPS